MVKRKCGTCCHFKDGGIAGSGWCQHPARRDLQHMVLVRKSELACRNGWDQDLWQAADAPLELTPSAHIPMPIRGGDSSARPDGVRDIAADASGDAQRAGEMFTDRITSISMPTRSQLRPERVDSLSADFADDAGEAGLATGASAVRDARRRRQEQRHLERRRNHETALQQAGNLLDTATPDDPSDEVIVRVRGIDGPLTARRDEAHPDAAGAGARPPREAQDERAAVGGRARPPSRSVEFRDAIPTFNDHGRSQARPNERRGSDDQSRPRVPAPPRREDERKPSGETEPWSTETVRRETRRRKEHPRPERAGKLAAETPIDLPPPVEPRPPKWVTVSGNPDPRVHETLTPPLPVDPIDAARRLGSVRRCCATCRDFRHVGDGPGGWCNNPYAFRERRMVQSDDIACRSSLGVWWLPHDDVWLELADTSHHSRPTPMLDESLGRELDGRHGMGPRS